MTKTLDLKNLMSWESSDRNNYFIKFINLQNRKFEIKNKNR